ncbi:hypothetical protein M1D49_24450 [Bacillus sp. PK3-056]|uniref:hypothetical protein n=2 Tax=Niallia TaxID=2837506 RepID=UPI00148FF5EE|nr:hypothetical protein [Niallia circulans]QJX60408.1 hypothetical protein HLK66_01160 [Niallia circulans]
MIKKNLQKRMISMAQPLQDTSSRLKLKEEGNPEDSRIILARLSEQGRDQVKASSEISA